MNPDEQNADRIIISMRLGWLAVETFGLLRRYARYGGSPPEKVEASRRFLFTERTPNLSEQLLISFQEFKSAAVRLAPDQALPIPADLTDLLQKVKSDQTELDRLWGEFENWSRNLWYTLLSQDPMAGQAFTCGGDLADTYWYPQEAGADRLAEMLRSYRLIYVAERVDDLAAYLPEHAAQAINHSLDQWSIGETVNNLDKAGQKHLLDRMEAQIKVWRDLLFGLRQVGSYLTQRDRREIGWGAVAGTIGFVILVGLVVWLAVLFLSGQGRSLLGTAMNMPLDTSKISTDVMTYLSNWQNWSAIMATVASVFAVLTGVIKGLSGWLWDFHRNLRQAFTLQRIKNRTYRSH